MNDTPPDVQAKYDEMIMSRSPSERVAMACSMFGFAKTLVTSGILRDRPEISPGELRAEIVRRFYANDLNNEQLERIIDQLIDRTN